MKKLFFILIVLLYSIVWAQAIVPDETPLATPGPTICACLMSFAFVPAVTNVQPLSDFQVDLDFYGNYDRLGSYGFTITYDPDMVEPAQKAIAAGDQGFLAAYNDEVPGVIKVTGFDVNGIGDYEGNFLELNFSSLDREGETRMTLEIELLTDVSGAEVWVDDMARAIVNIVTSCPNTMGDVNSDHFINIVDALLIARYYVDQESSHITECAADVNNDGKISIVDALLVAQYYVGLITEFK